ncbi:uncharacterized protein GGS22DRAFT_194663 [Annulohypoxylon maeteangense]|uniref:uncharacterized protein n=1 Tax=Annulohypoxylon maeteangense TaxID=1927788 RepID=UPI002007AC33|nr:uncharacterized protein GGS22DRAFT_194663 [Annulohypoxylon maeteangense]KAI0884058.1 hypothetical protein GGS22DRAFT_194663 [Annulohypoxylon maeteangense]
MSCENDFEQPHTNQASLKEHLDSLPVNHESREKGFILPNKNLLSRQLYGTCAPLTPESRIRSSYFVGSPMSSLSTRLLHPEDPLSDEDGDTDSCGESSSGGGSDDEEDGENVEDLLGKLRESVKGLRSVFCGHELWVCLVLILLIIDIVIIIILFPSSILGRFAAGY